MAKQTINIGASPNDGTGTPLRTAFDYTNQNFTELYTATGPSGNNIVVPGNATITGDLTVGTGAFGAGQSGGLIGNGKQVVFTNNSGSNSGWISNADNACIYSSGAGGAFAFNGHLVLQPRGSAAGAILFGTGNGAGAMSERYRIASDGVATWSNVGGVAGTAMTLNATGLGVGVSPAANTRLSVRTAATTDKAFGSDNGVNADFVIQYASGLTTIGSELNAPLAFKTNNVERLRIDTSGNVGIGVTPSAWTTSYNALNIGSGGSIAAYKSANYDQFYIGSNFFENTSGAWRFINNGYATQYWHNSGSHVWRISTTSNAAGANQPLTWTQAMTLDASGNLAIGAVSTGNRRLEVKSAGTSNTTFAAHFRDSADTLLFHVRSDGYFNTGQGALSPYNNITASAANMFVDSSGFVYRSTSSLKYKTDVKDSVHGLADVLKLRPVTYKSKNGDDTVFGGLIAEEVHAAGLTEFVAYAPDNTPDAIHYSNMVSLLVAAIQELAAEVNALKNA